MGAGKGGIRRVNAVVATVPPNTILFYSARRGDPAYHDLSNFAISRFSAPHPLSPEIGEVEYITNEHYFNAHKTLILKEFEAVRTASSPREAKNLGRKVHLRDEWDRRVRYTVMLDGLRLKFALPEFRDLLLSTGDAVLMEDSPNDYAWGGRDAQGGYTGRNLLGRALMKVRSELAT